MIYILWTELLCMVYLGIPNEFECIWNRFKNPDLIGFFNDFVKYFDENQWWIWEIRSHNKWEFFSRDYLDFLSNVLGNEKWLLDFLVWLREVLLFNDKLREKMYRKYTPQQFVETLFLLFHNQRHLQFNTQKLSIEDIFSQKVYRVLHHMNTSLSSSWMNVFQSLEKTISKWFFPISSQWELLLHLYEVRLWQSEFLTFPSWSRVIADLRWTILETLREIDSDEVDEGDGMQEDFLDWYFSDLELESMDVKELRLRLSMYEKWRSYLLWEWQILSRNEHAAYLIEYDTRTESLHDADSLEQISRETKNRLNAHFQAHIESMIKIIKSLLIKKIWLKSV